MQVNDLIKLTRSWIGTPYHNMAAVKGRGCDCLGLLRGVHAEVTGELINTPHYRRYPPRISTSVETLIKAADQHLIKLPTTIREPGVILIFRVHPKLIAWHCGIMTTKTEMIHSHSGREVYEITLGQRWESRVIAAYKFPGIEYK